MGEKKKERYTNMAGKKERDRQMDKRNVLQRDELIKLEEEKRFISIDIIIGIERLQFCFSVFLESCRCYL